MVMRAPVGVTGRGAQHAQMMEPFFLPLPGIKIVCPATAYDAKGLLKAAVRDGNPVLMFEHKLLYGSKGPRSESGAVDASSEIPDEDYIGAHRQGNRAAGRDGRDDHRHPAHDAPRAGGRGASWRRRASARR